MPDANDILTAEQMLALFRNEDVSWMEVAARLEISHKRLREQLDEAEDITNAMVERFAQVVGAFVETELARAHRSEARLARVTAALEFYAQHYGVIGARARNALAAVEEPAE